MHWCGDLSTLGEQNLPIDYFPQFCRQDFWQKCLSASGENLLWTGNPFLLIGGYPKDKFLKIVKFGLKMVAPVAQMDRARAS